MTYEMVMMVLKVVLYVVLGGLALYYRTNAKLKSFANDYIDEAEKTYKDTVKAGGQKHEFVVNKLYELVPLIMKPFFPKELVSAIVDNAFSAIESYAKQGLDKAVKAIEEKLAYTE